MINKDLPLIVHIDLNSCFAIIEQQANRLLRGRPVAVSAYDTPRGMVLASSYEAKRLGIKLGVNNGQARAICPEVVILTPDPAKYREAHRRFKELLLEFTSDVTPKSIDEFVLDFSGSQLLQNGSYEAHCDRMLEIGQQIKQRVREQLGEWVTVNVGIGTNRFLAKYAAGFGKPDGMTLLTYKNLTDYYSFDPYKQQAMTLVDLPGINIRYAARLKACGINTPLEFFNADQNILKKMVFKSVVGYYWWARLRGHEVDNRTFSTKSIGHQYALSKKTADKKELERLLMKLCEKVGRRLRRKNFSARGVHLYLGFIHQDKNTPEGSKVVDPGYDVRGLSSGFENMHKFRSWHEGHKLDYRLYATSDIFHAAQYLLTKAEVPAKVKIMAITVYDLEPWDPEQLSIFDRDDARAIGRDDHGTNTRSTEYRSQEATRRLSDAMDALNNRYGEFVITPGTMIDMKGEILDRIAFGNTPDI